MVLSQMRVKPVCREQSWPMPKGNLISLSPHFFGQLGDGNFLMACWFVGAPEPEARAANGVVAMVVVVVVVVVMQ